MPPLVFEYDKGVNNQDEGRTPQGFVTFMQNWIYDPDDQSRIFKIFGRTTNGALPSSASAGNTYGFDYFKYSNGSNVFVLATNSQLYTATASQAIGSWASVVDKSVSPLAFVRSGTYLKTISTGDNRYIAFSGALGERALIRDEDGDWHYVGMNKPPPLDLAGVTILGAFTRPTSSNDPATIAVPYGSTNRATEGGFVNPGRAYDNDANTFAQAQFLVTGTAYNPTNPIRYRATDWIFSAAGNTPVAQRLSIKMGLADVGATPLAGAPSGSYCFYYALVSTNGGSTYTVVYSGNTVFGNISVETTINSGVTWSQIRVRIIVSFFPVVSQAAFNVYEISAKAQDQGRTTAIAAGTYYYAQTEVYEVTLASGATIAIESAPSQAIGVAADGATSFGNILTLPGSATVNLLTDGYKHDPTNSRTLYRRIYRSTSTGVWPDLGYVGTAAIDQTNFVDDFIRVSETTLGTPSINVVYAGVAALNAASPAPPFRDATAYRGAIVCIPSADPYRIQWSLPGFPDYWPLPAHDLATLPTARNDQLVGVSSVGEYLIIFTRTRLLRMRDLPFVDRPNFDPALIQVDILSPNEGLAGEVFGYCTFQSQKGFSALAWVSASGIWMTDGSLPNEGGLGIVKLTTNLNWRKLVDPAQLTSARLTYDPILQAIFFDYYDTAGKFKTLMLHTAPTHWVQSEQDHSVTKVSGPHTVAKLQRIIGDFQNELHHWSIDTVTLTLQNERIGNGDTGQSILSVMETGWQQPAGPQEEYLCDLGSLYHSDWGPSETCDLDLLARRDDTGVIQELRKSGIPLAGNAVSNFYINRASKSFRVRLTHQGLTTSNGQIPIKALGPVGIDGEVMDAMFGV